jgi:hypothetical protein
MVRAADWEHPGISLGQRYARIERLRRLARFLDTAVGIPGTRIRFGADSVIGLAPGVGDALTGALALYIVYEARRLGLPRRKITRMLWNVGIDTAVGAIPVLGDLFDVAFKANRRNVDIIDRHFADALSR